MGAAGNSSVLGDAAPMDRQDRGRSGDEIGAAVEDAAAQTVAAIAAGDSGASLGLVVGHDDVGKDADGAEVVGDAATESAASVAPTASANPSIAAVATERQVPIDFASGDVHWSAGAEKRAAPPAPSIAAVAAGTALAAVAAGRPIFLEARILNREAR